MDTLTDMKLSDKTIKLLKNFSSINQSILFKEGSKLRTISVMKNILAEATVDEEFPKDFGIYDLVQFLNGLDLHETPELDFTRDEHVVIREGKMTPDFNQWLRGDGLAPADAEDQVGRWAETCANCGSSSGCSS